MCFNDRGDLDIKVSAVASAIVLYIYIYTAIFRKPLLETETGENLTVER